MYHIVVAGATKPMIMAADWANDFISLNQIYYHFLAIHSDY